VTYFLNFGTPSISRERLKLETSNLARRLATGQIKRNNAKLGQMGSIRGHVTYFWNFGTPAISQKLLKTETSNLICRLATSGPKQKCKTRSKGFVKASHDLLLEFWDPLHILGTVKGKNFKFSTQIGNWGS